VLLPELSRAGVGPLTVGASGRTIRGLVLNHGPDHIEIKPGINNVTIAGNFIGTNPAGTVAQPNIVGGFGIRVDGGNNNTIGGSTPADRNLISGSPQGGIFVGLSANDAPRIEGNYTGADVTGTTAVGNLFGGPGIEVRGDSTTNTAIVNNLISGNAGGGIEDGSVGGVIQGNLIGAQK